VGLGSVGLDIFGLFGNVLYLRHANRRIVEIKNATKEEEERRQQLAKHGGTSWLMAFVPAVIWATFIVSLALLTTARLGTKLVINDGDLYYTSSVTESQAQSLGDYFVAQSIFDGNKRMSSLRRTTVSTKSDL